MSSSSSSSSSITTTLHGSDGEKQVEQDAVVRLADGGGTIVNQIVYPRLHLIKMTNHLKSIMTMLRNRETPRDRFIFYADRLIRLLIEEALSYLPFEEKNVTTPTNSEYAGLKLLSKICGVSVVRSGESMEAGLRQVCQKVRIGKILITRDEKNNPQARYAKLPPDISGRRVLLLDPMLATGGSVSEAIRVLLEYGVHEENIFFLNLIAAPEGIETLTKKYSRVTIITTEIDRTISEAGVSLPGVGDFGDRYFGTE
eukprot:TRINITY_DN2331_c0_g2_i1.p1 TRINITY_DN2331_c0_g2~~TRINITY_DN2331_c0_g2_i1.p1  ORF type:complete len:256 (-),score=101.85 TRINITY_DN2331_c0_g2_i1:173-940(-)